MLQPRRKQQTRLGRRTITCICGKNFVVFDNFPRFCCSRVCHSERKKQLRTRICAQCHKPWVTRSGTPKQQRFCSQTCMGTANRTGKTLACKSCKKAIYVTPLRRKKYRAFFCSRTCATTWQQRRLVLINCRFCKKQFKVSRSTIRLRGAYGVNFCSRACCLADPVRKKKIISFIEDRRQTALETAGYRMLDEEGVTYLPQHTVLEIWCVDAFVPSKNLVVQFDGNYWHGNPAKFPNPTAKQIKQRNKDRGQVRYLTHRGFRVLRIWEDDLYKRPEAVRRRLRRALAKAVPVKHAT